MNSDTYELESSNGATAFSFVNDGPNGKYSMGIQYSATVFPNIWNLAFGVRKSEEENDTDEMVLDDFAITDNGNRDQIMATVIESIFKFWEFHPDKMVILQGSTAPRHRMYRGIINLYREELRDRVDFFGFVEKTLQFPPYQPPGTGYDAFLLRPK